MTKPNSNSAQKTKQAISTQHQVYQGENISELDQWFDEQLADLEERFQGFVTRNSLKRSIRS